jgi:P pilus assembly chaperone PapD
VNPYRIFGTLCVAALGAVLTTSPACAELALSNLIVELLPGKHIREDVEVWNNSPERSFVAIEPREIIDPSLPSQKDFLDPDPEKLGLLVSPSRMILEPGQRKLVRIVAISAGADREHVYRVTVKPVTGGVQSTDTGLMVVVGYDVLVLVRPAQPIANVTANRTGRKLTFSNSGNVSVEVVEGRQCDTARQHCTALPGKRLYAGASWAVELPSDQRADYVLKSPGKTERRSY